MLRRAPMPATLAAATASHAAPGLVAALRRGGLVACMRHATTGRSLIDTGRLGDRAGPRNLSAAGRRQSPALGRTVGRIGIPIGAVLAQAPASGNDILAGHILLLGMVLGRPLAQAEFPKGALAVFRPGSGEAAPSGIVTAEEIISAAG